MTHEGNRWRKTEETFMTYLSGPRKRLSPSFSPASLLKNLQAFSTRRESGGLQARCHLTHTGCVASLAPHCWLGHSPSINQTVHIFQKPAIAERNISQPKHRGFKTVAITMMMLVMLELHFGFAPEVGGFCALANSHLAFFYQDLASVSRGFSSSLTDQGV